MGQNDEVFNEYYAKSGWDHEYWFGTVPLSMSSIFQVITLDKWAEFIVRHVIVNDFWGYWMLVFPVFILITTFGFCFMIVGILLDSILNYAKANKELELRRAKERQQRVIHSLRD